MVGLYSTELAQLTIQLITTVQLSVQQDALQQFCVTALNLNDLDRSDDAQDLLSNLIASRPNDHRAAFTMANILRGHSKFEEAAFFYTKALGLLSGAAARHWVIFYFRGICYERSGEWDKAERDFRQALTLKPDQPLVLNYLGYSLIERGDDVAAAFAMIEKATELRPNDGYIIDSLGSGLLALGRTEEALEAFEQAVTLRPEDPVIAEHYGDALAMAGRHREASHAFRWALQLDPPAGRVDDLKAKLADTESALSSAAESEDTDTDTEQPAEPAVSSEEIEDDGSNVEVTFWNSVRDSDDPEMLQAYLDQFPDGVFAPLAKIKLKRLGKSD